MTKDIIEEFRRIIIPYMVNRFEEINYEGKGGSDAEEFKSDFNEICDLANKALEQEPITKNNLGVDCIDRNSIKYYPGTGGYMYASKGEIDKLPSVTPIRPKGHWIEYSWNDNGIARWGLKCDKCFKKYKYGGEMWGNPNFCPNCGADMKGNTKRKGEHIEGNNESYNCENWIHER